MTDLNRRTLYIAQECMKAGMTAAGAAGVLANVEAESAFISINVQDSFNRALGISDEEFVRRVDAGDTALFMTPDLGFGLAQWTAQDRKEKYLSHFRKLGVSIGDFRTQVDYLILDMRTFWSKKPWNTCISSNDPYQCGYSMCKYYEICSDLENASDSRGKRARDHWYGFVRASVTSGLAVEAPATETTASVTPEPELDEDGIPIEKTWPPRTIDSHCSGWPEVWLLQAILKCRGYNTLIDGIWGSALTDKFKQFQQEHGLDPDAVAGPMSWAELMRRG